MTFKSMFTDLRYWAYHMFTVLVIAVMLLIEDLLEAESQVSDVLLEMVLDIPVFTVFILLMSTATMALVKFLNRRLPWEEALWKRFMAEMCTIIAMVVVLTLGSGWTLRTFDLLPHDASGDGGYEGLALIMFFISTFMTFAFHEFMFLSSDKQFLAFKASRLEKQNYMIKYEALKNQINPHFLFNSLNTLSSLIYQDTGKSDQFIKKFADVFRYVLELNQEQLVPVKREISFLDAYLFLQKFRYGEALLVEKSLSSDLLNAKIPPLSLQLVVENAIKHNVISQQQPLRICIESDQNTLVVKNNYQHRENLGESTGIGQKNLIEKYRLINMPLPEFSLNGDEYHVRLPLIDKELAWPES